MNVTKYLLSTIVSQSMLVVRGFVVPRFLGPANYGVLSGLQLIVAWGNYLHLGVNSGMERETCVDVSQGDSEERRLFRSSALGFVLLISSLGCAGIWLFSFCKMGSYPIVALWGIRVFGLVMLFKNLQVTLTSIARTENFFNLISKGQMLKGALVAITDIILAYLFGLEGLFISLIITTLIIFWYFLHPLKQFFALKIRVSKLKNMLQIGFPLLISGLLITFQNSIDKIMILTYLNVVQLGFYSIGIQLANYIFLIPHQIAWILVTYVYKFSGEISDLTDLQKVLFVPSFVTSVITAMLSGVVIVLLPGLLFLVLPKFLPGMFAIKILVVGIFFRALSLNTNAIIVALKRQNTYLIFTFIACVIAIISNYSFIKLGMGINGVAIATALAYFIFSNILLIYTSLAINVAPVDLVLFLIKLYLPLTWCILVIFSLEKLVGIRMEMPVNTMIFFSFIRLSIFVTLFIPIIWWLNKKTLLVTEILSLVKKKVGRRFLGAKPG